MLSYLLVLVLGLVFGSFASALSYRYVVEQGAFGNSRCPKCKKALGPIDLIPLLSFFILGGKCRKCKEAIPLRYPAQEFLMALFFMINHHINGVSAISIVIYIVIFGLIVMSFTDLISYAVPDQMLLLFLVCGIFYALQVSYPLVHFIVMPILLGFIAFFLKYACLIFFKKDGLGIADIKIFALSGLYLNVENISAFLLMAGLFGIFIGIMWRYSGKRTKRFPFVPAIALSFIMCILFPQETQIVNWLVASTAKNVISIR